MIEPIQILLVLFVLFALSRAVLRFNGKEISGKQFLFWLFIWIFAIIAIAVPRTITFLSELFGIGRPADLMLYVAIVLLFYLIFRMYVSIEAVEEDITKIIRELAIKKVKKK